MSVARSGPDTAVGSRPVERAGAAPVQILAVVALGYLLASWAMNPVAGILPTISLALQIDVTLTGWLMNAYFVLLVGWVLTAGRLGDAFGHGVVFRVGCLVFALGSLLCMLPAGYAPLLVGRAIQGVGSAMIFGTSLAIIAAAFPGPRLGWAVGVLTMSSGTSSLVGVWISTSLVRVADWHWAFLPPVLIGLTAFALGGRLPSVRRLHPREVDWLGGVLLFAAITVLLLGLNHLHDGPETFEAGADYHLPMHAAAGALLVVFLWHETRAPRPLIKLSLLRNVRLTTGVIANGIAHSSMLATSLLIPFLLERGRGHSPADTGQLLIVMQVCLIGASYAGGWLYSRHGTPLLGVTSMLVLAAGLLLLGQFGSQLSYGALLPVVAVLGTGLGLFTTVNNTAIMRSVTGDQRGFGSGLVETTRQLGHSLGVSVSSGLLAASVAAAPIPELGYREGFAEAAWAMGLVCAVGVAFVLYPVLQGRLAARAAAA